MKAAPYYLAKADKGIWHPLAAHSADVAAVLERLLLDDSHIAKRIRRLAHDTDWDSFRAVLVYLAFLHDIGKVNSKFQRGVLEYCFGGPKRPLGHVKIIFDTLFSAGHSNVGLRFLEVFTDLVSPMSDTEGIGPQLLATFLAHHGRPHNLAAAGPGDMLNLDELWGRPINPGLRPPLEEIRRIASLGMEKSGLTQLAQPIGLPSDPALTHLLAGLITLSDWIGSTRTAFPFNPNAEDDLDTYWGNARRRADQACRSIGLIASRGVIHPKPDALYQALFPEVFGPNTGNQPTKLQHEIAKRPGRAGGELRLIEAATGSGKTEAALAHFAQLRASGEVGGLMFALPTRATAHAMKVRIEGLVERLYTTDPPTVTLAVGGNAPISEATQNSLAEPPTFLGDELDIGEKLTTWSTDHHKKFLAGEIVVGTIDQALLAALVVKHAHLRLASLSRHLLVVDEVHSHDDYMTSVLKVLLGYHISAGGHALLMSATLSSAARSELVDMEPPTLEEALAVPYPTLAIAEENCGWTNIALERHGSNRSVAWALSSERNALEAAQAAAEAGARVCWIRNTVTSAKSTVAQIMTESPLLAWGPRGSNHKTAYHSRFSGPDRTVLDDAITADFGKRGERNSSILVATQVVEQSLDVDFDLVISDLAPVEILLQRIGRLHRHRARDGLRPEGYREPRFLVVAPDKPFSPGATAPQGSGWGTVYANMIALELTRRTIESNPTIHLPDDYRRLMEDVYDRDTVETFTMAEGWLGHQMEVEGKAAAYALHARDCVLSFWNYYGCDEARFQSELKVRTRLGDDSVEVKLNPPAPCWYARDSTASTVAIPLKEALRSDVSDLSDLTAKGAVSANGEAEYQLGRLTLTYGPSGWNWAR